MDVHRLIKMANEIGAFFEAEPDQAVGLEGVATHIQRFWEPRMRRELLRWVDEHDGQGLTELVLAAIQANREKLTSQATPSS